MAIRTVICSLNNGAGLPITAGILARLLKDHGHETSVHDFRSRPPRDMPRDCTVFLERINPLWFSRCNVLIPNPEWLHPLWVGWLSHFDLIICKTRETKRLMDAIDGTRTFYTGWTSRDRRLADVQRDWDRCLHVVGRSSQKGTEAVLAAWDANPDFPPLTVLDWRKDVKVAARNDRVNFIRDRLPEAEHVKLLNECGVHLCPSAAEGFGHTLHEAMSCGAVLITTDAPPMNEQAHACGAVVPPVAIRPMALATAYHVDASGIAAAVRKVMAMSHQERDQLGQRARWQWQKNRHDFKTAMATAAKMIAEALARPRQPAIEINTGSAIRNSLFRA